MGNGEGDAKDWRRMAGWLGLLTAVWGVMMLITFSWAVVGLARHDVLMFAVILFTVVLGPTVGAFMIMVAKRLRP